MWTKVTFKDEELTKDKFPIDFINLREKFCLSLYNEVKSYYPENTFEYFEIFVPKKMPRTVVKLIHTVIMKYKLLQIDLVWTLLQQVKNGLTCLSQWFKKMVTVTS